MTPANCPKARSFGLLDRSEAIMRSRRGEREALNAVARQSFLERCADQSSSRLRWLVPCIYGKCFIGATMDGFLTPELKRLPTRGLSEIPSAGVAARQRDGRDPCRYQSGRAQKIDRLVLQFWRERLYQAHLERLRSAIDGKVHAKIDPLHFSPRQ